MRFWFAEMALPCMRFLFSPPNDAILPLLLSLPVPLFAPDVFRLLSGRAKFFAGVSKVHDKPTNYSLHFLKRVFNPSRQMGKKDTQTLWLLFGALSLEAHFLVGVPQLLDVFGVLQTPWSRLFVFRHPAPRLPRLPGKACAPRPATPARIWRQIVPIATQGAPCSDARVLGVVAGRPVWPYWDWGTLVSVAACWVLSYNFKPHFVTILVVAIPTWLLLQVIIYTYISTSMHMISSDAQLSQ